mgnify:CR=1 FL=1
MKKIICLILSAVLVVSLSGCGKDKATVNEESIAVNVTVQKVKKEKIEK